MNIEEIKNNMIPNEIKYICMNCEKNIFCQNKGCAFRSLGNEYCDDVLKAAKLYLEKDKEIERLNNIINQLEKLELYTAEEDYDYEENIIEKYVPFDIEDFIKELKGDSSNE